MKEVKGKTVNSVKTVTLFLGISVLIIGIPLGIATYITNRKINKIHFSKKESFVLTENSKKLLKYLEHFQKSDYDNISDENILFSYDLSPFEYFNKFQQSQQFISQYDFDQFLSQKFFWDLHDVHQKNNNFIKKLNHQKNLEFFIKSLKIDSPFQSDQKSLIFSQAIIDDFGKNIKENLSKSFFPSENDSVEKTVLKKNNKKDILKQIFIKEAWNNLLPPYFNSVNINNSFTTVLQEYFEIFYNFFVEREKTIDIKSFTNYWSQNFDQNFDQWKDLFNILNIDLNIDLETKENRENKKWFSFFKQNLQNIYGQIKISQLHDVFAPYFSKSDYFENIDIEIQKKVEEKFVSLMEKHHLSTNLIDSGNFSNLIFKKINDFLKKYQTIYQFTFKDYIDIIASSLDTLENDVVFLKTNDIFKNFDNFNSKLKKYFSFENLKKLFNDQNLLLQKKYLEIQSFEFLLKEILELKDQNNHYFVKNFWSSSQWFQRLFESFFTNIFSDILINSKTENVDPLKNNLEYQKNEFLHFLQTFFDPQHSLDIETFLQQDLQRLTSQLNEIILKSWSSSSLAQNNEIFKKKLQDFFLIQENANILKELFNRYHQQKIDQQKFSNKLQEHNGFIESFIEFIREDFDVENNLSSASLINFISQKDKFLFLENKNLDVINSTDISKLLYHYFNLQKDDRFQTQKEKLKMFKKLSLILLNKLDFNDFYLSDKFIEQIYSFFASGQFFKEILKEEFNSLIPLNQKYEFFDVYSPEQFTQQIDDQFFENDQNVSKLKEIKTLHLLQLFYSSKKEEQQKKAIFNILFNTLNQGEDDLNVNVEPKIKKLSNVIYDFIKEKKIFLPPLNYKNEQKSFYDIILKFNDAKIFEKINDIISYKIKSFETFNKLEQIMMFFFHKVNLFKNDIKDEDLSFIKSQFQLLIDQDTKISEEVLQSISEKWLYDQQLKETHGNYGYKFESLEEMVLSNVDVSKFEKFINSKPYRNRFESIEHVWKDQILQWLQISETKLKKDSIIYQLSNKVSKFVKYFSQNINGDNSFPYAAIFKKHFNSFNTSNQWQNNINTFLFDQIDSKINKIIDIFKTNKDSKIIENKIFNYLEQSNFENNLFFTSLNKSLKNVIFDYFNYLKFYKMTPFLNKLIINFKAEKKDFNHLKFEKEIHKNLNKNKWLLTFPDFLANEIDSINKLNEIKNDEHKWIKEEMRKISIDQYGDLTNLSNINVVYDSNYNHFRTNEQTTPFDLDTLKIELKKQIINKYSEIDAITLENMKTVLEKETNGSRDLGTSGELDLTNYTSAKTNSIAAYGDLKDLTNIIVIIFDFDNSSFITRTQKISFNLDTLKTELKKQINDSTKYSEINAITFENIKTVLEKETNGSRDLGTSGEIDLTFYTASLTGASINEYGNLTNLSNININYDDNLFTTTTQTTPFNLDTLKIELKKQIINKDSIIDTITFENIKTVLEKETNGSRDLGTTGTIS